jgi:hypothetical protein
MNAIAAPLHHLNGLLAASAENLSHTLRRNSTLRSSVPRPPAWRSHGVSPMTGSDASYWLKRVAHDLMHEINSDFSRERGLTGLMRRSGSDLELADERG